MELSTIQERKHQLQIELENLKYQKDTSSQEKIISTEEFMQRSKDKPLTLVQRKKTYNYNLAARNNEISRH